MKTDLNTFIPQIYPDEEAYKLALKKLKKANYKNKFILIDEKLNVSYAGFLRRLIEKIKGLFCGVNQMQREIVVYRLLNFLELGASKGWLDKKRAFNATRKFIYNPNGSKNAEIEALIDKLTQNRGFEQNQFSQHYAQKHVKELKSLVVNTSGLSLQPLSSSLKTTQVSLNYFSSEENNNNETKEINLKLKPPAATQSILKENPEKSNQVKSADEISGPIEVNSPEEILDLEPLVMFIYKDEGSIQGVINSLRKGYPDGIFTTEENAQDLIKQNEQKPISAFYIQRFDGHVDSLEALLPSIENILSRYNVNLVYIGAFKKGLNTILESELMERHKNLQEINHPNPRVHQTPMLSIYFENDVRSRPGSGSIENEKSVFENIKTLLKHQPRLVLEKDSLAQQKSAPSQTPKNRLTSSHTISEVTSLSPIEKNEESVVRLPVFIYQSGCIEPLEKRLRTLYPQGIFVEREKAQTVLKENSQRAIQVFYIDRVDTRFEYFENLAKTIDPFLFSDNINFLYIAVSKKGAENPLEEGVESLKKYLESSKFYNQRLKHVQTFAFRYDAFSSSHTIQNEKLVLEKLNSLIRSNPLT